jgi:hypothetical protein
MRFYTSYLLTWENINTNSSNFFVCIRFKSAMIGETFSLAQWTPGWSGTSQEEYRFLWSYPIILRLILGHFFPWCLLQSFLFAKILFMDETYMIYLWLAAPSTIPPHLTSNLFVFTPWHCLFKFCPRVVCMSLMWQTHPAQCWWIWGREAICMHFSSPFKKNILWQYIEREQNCDNFAKKNKMLTFAKVFTKKPK